MKSLYLRSLCALLIGAALYAALAPASLAAKKEVAPALQPADFVPVAEGASLFRLESESWVAEGDGWAIWLKPISREERLNFIKRKTGFGIDPYAARPGQQPVYFTFLLVVENRGSSALDFSPQSAWLRTNRQQVLLPQGLAELSFNYRVMGRELPVAYEQIKGALYEAAVSIPPGERSAGLLVYDMLRPKTKSWNLSLRMTLPSGDRIALAAPYERVKPPKKKK